MKTNRNWRIEPAETTARDVLNCGVQRSAISRFIRPRKAARNNRRIWHALIVCGLLFSLAMPNLALADASVYEGFDYSSVGSDLNGNSGGNGFAGPWVPGGYNASLFDNYDIAAGSLTFGSLVVSGNRVHSSAVNAIAGLTRPLSEPFGAAGTTRYISFLVRPEGTLGAGISTVSSASYSIGPTHFRARIRNRPSCMSASRGRATSTSWKTAAAPCKSLRACWPRVGRRFWWWCAPTSPMASTSLRST